MTLPTADDLGKALFDTLVRKRYEFGMLWDTSGNLQFKNYATGEGKGMSMSFNGALANLSHDGWLISYVNPRDFYALFQREIIK